MARFECIRRCPKDDFSLPHIDVLVDKAAKNAHIFIHGWILWIRYNYIRMAKEDKEKTTLFTL
jgi:hypothetical protein